MEGQRWLLLLPFVLAYNQSCLVAFSLRRDFGIAETITVTRIATLMHFISFFYLLELRNIP